MISSVLKELTEAAAELRLVSIARRDLQELTGFPLAVGSRLVLVRHVNAEMLLPDGYAIVRVQDVTAVRASEWDHAVQRALAAESLLPDPAGTPAVRLDDWASALADLYARGEPVSLECEDDEGGYAMGMLTTVGEDRTGIRHVAADGTWEDEDWTFYHASITIVTIGRRYVELFSRVAGDLP
ncbi:MAG TPA: hypothetical protein VF006_31860 [Longimicrobium sp.]